MSYDPRRMIAFLRSWWHAVPCTLPLTFWSNTHSTDLYPSFVLFVRTIENLFGQLCLIVLSSFQWTRLSVYLFRVCMSLCYLKCPFVSLLPIKLTRRAVCLSSIKEYFRQLIILAHALVNFSKKNIKAKHVSQSLTISTHVKLTYAYLLLTRTFNAKTLASNNCFKNFHLISFFFFFFFF